LIVAVAGLVGSAEGQEQLALRAVLQDDMMSRAADPHVALGIDADPVRPADQIIPPRPDELPVRIEPDYRRLRAMEEIDLSPIVAGDGGARTERDLRWHLEEPRDRLELDRFGCAGGARQEQGRGQEQCGAKEVSHARPVYRRTSGETVRCFPDA